MSPFDPDWAEVLWTTIAVIGTFYTSRNLQDALRDLRAVEDVLPRNGRYVFARANVRAELLRVCTMVGFVMIGVLSMFRPDNPDHSTSRLVVVTLFILMEFLIVLNSALDARMRHVVMDVGIKSHDTEKETDHA